MSQVGSLGPKKQISPESNGSKRRRSEQPRMQESERASNEGVFDAFALKHRWLEWVVPAILCVLLLGQLFFSVRRLSQTADESTHLYAGYRYWKCADLGFGSEHPPLAKLVAAAPLLSTPIAEQGCAVIGNEADSSLNWLYGMTDWDSVLFRARAAISVFSLGLCILVWMTARLMFGFTEAVLATTLLACEPNVLAHGALVTTDMVVTFAFLFAVYAYYRYLTGRSSQFLLLSGLATGLALAAKHSGVVVIPVLAVLATLDALLQSDERRARWRNVLLNMGGAALICAIAVGVLWVVYGFHFSARPGDTAYWTSLQSNASGLLSILHSLHVLPEAYLGGLQGASGLANQIGWTVIWGKVYPHGQWFFFPLVIVIKFTAALLALLVLGAISVRFLYRDHRRELLFLLVPVIIFLAVSMHTTMNAGVRHILPVVPLLLIFAAAAVLEWARHLHWIRWVVILLVVLHAASSLRAFPNYLSYANELWGGPTRLYEYLPNSDWGEAYKQVKIYVDEHHAEPCWVLTYFRMNPKSQGIPCDSFVAFGGHAAPRQAIPPRMKGTVIVSSSAISAIDAQPGGVLFAFTQVKPKDHIGGSAMLVYEGDFDTHTVASWNEVNAAYDMMAAKRPADMLLHARRAVEFEPFAPTPHGVLCQALVTNGLLNEAKTECGAALSMLTDQTIDLKMLGTVRNIVEQLGQPGALATGNSGKDQ